MASRRVLDCKIPDIYIDPGNLDRGNLSLGNLDSGHRPGRWLWRREKRTAALLVKRTSAAVSALQYQPSSLRKNDRSQVYLWAVKASSPGKAWVRVTTKTPGGVSAALPLQGRTSLGHEYNLSEDTTATHRNTTFTKLAAELNILHDSICRLTWLPFLLPSDPPFSLSFRLLLLRRTCNTFFKT